MKITTEEIVDDNNLLGHIILNSIGKFPTICENIREKGFGELKMTIDDVDIDIKSFVDHWQSEVDRIVAEKAKEIVNNRMCDLQNIISDCSDAMQTKIDEMYNFKN